MLPLTLLPQLSPAAAKVYLVLVCAHRSQSDNRIPVITISLDIISQLAALSRRTCTFALQELGNLKLLRRLPRRYPRPPILPPPQARGATPCARHPNTRATRCASHPLTGATHCA